MLLIPAWPDQGGNYLMGRPFFTRLFISLLLSVSFFVTGCGSLKSVYGDRFHAARSKPRDISHGDKSSFRKKVLVAPAINMAGLNDEKTEQIDAAWVKLFEKDASLLVTSLTGFKSPQSAATSTETGVFTDPALIKKAEEMGMNILVTLVLEPLNYNTGKGILWPFNKLEGDYDVSIVANAIDTISGTVIFSFKETEKIKIGRVPEGQGTPVPLDEKILDDVLHKLQKRQSSAMLDVLDEQPWRGKIILDGEKIKISGGSDIGITAGNVFEVFTKGEELRSATGESYYSDGSKAGEIKVTDVMEDHSIAVPLGEKVFETGQIISFKSR
jgi:hypothetical protein